jgi:hypothetical protein
VIDDESLVKTRTNICLSYASAVSSYSVPEVNARCIRHFHDVFEVASSFLNLSI